VGAGTIVADPHLAPARSLRSSYMARLPGVLTSGAWLSCGVLIAASLFRLPAAPGTGLDPSWRMAMTFFFDQRLQFGPEVIFTYGPLGFLMHQTYTGLLFHEQVAWMVARSLLVGAIVLALARRLGPLGVFPIVFAAFLGHLSEDALHTIMLAAVGLHLVRRAAAPAAWHVHCAVALAALLALMKFTHLVLAAASVALPAAAAWHAHARSRGLRLAAAFAAAFLVGWVLCGQSPWHLPAYLMYSWHISAAYPAAMALPAPGGALWSALGVLAAVAVYAVSHVLQHRDGAALARVILLALFGYVTWKQGFTRADEHMIDFFVAALMAALALPVVLESTRPLSRAQRGAIVLAALLAFAGLLQLVPDQVSRPLGGLADRLRLSASAVTGWAAHRDRLEDAWSEQRRVHDLPRTRAIVGGATIDVLGHEQSVALFNRLSYRPRPVFQGYAAYSGTLQALNERHYASPSAPDFVLVRLQTIDGRALALDDAQVLHSLPHRYEHVLSEGEVHLWRRRADGSGVPAQRSSPALSEQGMAFGSRLEIGRFASQPLWAEIDMRLSLLGQVREWLYQPPLVWLEIEDSAGTTERLRLPTSQAKAGFLLNPHLSDTAAYLFFAGHRFERTVRAVRLLTEPSDASLWRTAPCVTLRAAALPPPDAGALRGARAIREGKLRTGSAAP
jgi:hypothetical protein